MMKNWIFIFWGINVFLLQTSYSQITITNNDMPAAGDIFFTASTSQIGLNYDTTGQNVYWDFSTLDTLNTKTDTMRTVLSTNAVYVVMFNNVFDQEHLASFAYQTDNSNFSNNFIQIDDIYNFFQNTNTHYVMVGFGAVVNGVPTAAKYNAPEKYFDFPLNYGVSDSSVSVWSMDVPNFGYYGQTIHRHFEVDGWGTVVTPAGTFQSLRVKNIIDIRDTFYVDSLSIGTAFDRPQQTEYVWMAQGEGIPVLKASEINGNITNVSYKIYSLPSLASNFNQEISINGYYVHELRSVFIENPRGKHLNIRIVSINGQVVLLLKSFQTLIKIPDEKIGKGIILLQITDDEGRYLVRKITIP